MVSQISLLTADPYAVNNFEDGNPLYVGKAKSDGTWLVERFSPTTTLKEYANTSNNTSIATYAAAWAARATLTYGTFQSITGV